MIGRRVGKLATVAALAALPLVTASSAGTGGTLAVKCLGATATKVGTNGNDIIRGTPGRDVIVGRGGEDQIFGGAGNDLICGGDGNDIIAGEAGDDRIDGGSGTDVLAGRDGNDRLEGGPGPDGLQGGPGDDWIDGGPGLPPAGLDIVAYDDANGPVQVDLAAGMASGEGTDVLRRIETVSGSRFDDILLGDSSINFLAGGRGNDVLDGRGGEDMALFDQIAVTANLASGTATGEGADQLKNLEGIIGSHKADVLVGDDGANYLSGGDGNDKVAGVGGEDRVFGDKGSDTVDGGQGDDIVGGDAGNDVLSGGGGRQDTVSYLGSPHPVRVDLATGQETGDGADSLSGFQNVSGSQLNDRIVGDAEANGLSGNAGQDTITAGRGADFLGGGTGENTLHDGPGVDYCLTGTGSQKCEIKGVPGPLPGGPALPPIKASGLGSQLPVSMERFAPVHPGGIGRLRSIPARERTAVTRFADRIESIMSAFNPARATANGRTASYDYAGQPTCFAAEKPYRTTIAPPKRVEPIGRAPQRAWWQATLYRETAGKWTRYRTTPWATGSISGLGITGAPVWQDAKHTGFIRSFTEQVPPGKYVWKGEIYWERTRGTVYRAVEPHIVYAPAVRHAKICAFAP